MGSRRGVFGSDSNKRNSVPYKTQRFAATGHGQATRNQGSPNWPKSFNRQHGALYVAAVLTGAVGASLSPVVGLNPCHQKNHRGLLSRDSATTSTTRRASRWCYVYSCVHQSLAVSRSFDASLVRARRRPREMPRGSSLRSTRCCWRFSGAVNNEPSRRAGNHNS